jgi:predicted metal-dependent HD superfamily phosphohydrolase
VPIGYDEQILTDIDLSILGAEARAFSQYEKRIRFEYAWVPWDEYSAGRARILQSFLDRTTIYSTPLFIQMYEARARENLARSIEKLK